MTPLWFWDWYWPRGWCVYSRPLFVPKPEWVQQTYPIVFADKTFDEAGSSDEAFDHFSRQK